MGGGGGMGQLFTSSLIKHKICKRILKGTQLFCETRHIQAGWGGTVGSIKKKQISLFLAGGDGAISIFGDDANDSTLIHALTVCKRYIKRKKPPKKIRAWKKVMKR